MTRIKSKKYLIKIKTLAYCQRVQLEFSEGESSCKFGSGSNKISFLKICQCRLNKTIPFSLD